MEMEMEIPSMPKKCISSILSLTSPEDAIRLSLVASNFRSAADSDAVWETFLPSDYKDIISRAFDFSSSSLIFESKKDLYLRLCDSPLLIDDGQLCFWLDKQTRKKCYMIAPRALHISWGDTPGCWKWISVPESRFPEVAVLLSVCWLEIRGRIKSSFLSPKTTYAAYLVFKLEDEHNGFTLDFEAADVSVGTNASTSQTRSAFLCHETWHQQSIWAHVPIEDINQKIEYPNKRSDGWFEVELGEIFIKRDDGNLEMSVLETKKQHRKTGLIVQGIEVRPKKGN
ncbi:Phloem protein 2-like [Dillenia turbinata]|uniref:Phloem protein 2-like n=1 Tax=Dillenia turbinata TaxID=194707 RepID=A0AAN8YVZ0_9MAGN